MMSAFTLILWSVVLALASPVDLPDAGARSQAARATFKVAYYNIQSGMGTAALTGTCAFERNPNCTDRTKPLNAWGAGVVQKELERAVKNDPSIVALGLGEAWNCATPDAVLKVLGWAAHAGERNGISLQARYGFAGPAEWLPGTAGPGRRPRIPG